MSSVPPPSRPKEDKIGFPEGFPAALTGKHGQSLDFPTLKPLCYPLLLYKHGYCLAIKYSSNLNPHIYLLHLRFFLYTLIINQYLQFYTLHIWTAANISLAGVTTSKVSQDYTHRPSHLHQHQIDQRHFLHLTLNWDWVETQFTFQSSNFLNRWTWSS